MGYLTNFDPADYSNHDAVVAKVNEIFHTEIETRPHPRPDKDYPEHARIEGLHSLWSPQPLRIKSGIFPYPLTEWFSFYLAHLHWTPNREEFNTVWQNARQEFAKQGIVFPHPYDTDK